MIRNHKKQRVRADHLFVSDGGVAPLQAEEVGLEAPPLLVHRGPRPLLVPPAHQGVILIHGHAKQRSILGTNRYALYLRMLVCYPDLSCWSSSCCLT